VLLKAEVSSVWQSRDLSVDLLDSLSNVLSPTSFCLLSPMLLTLQVTHKYSQTVKVQAIIS
jgi:hypothetical protein